MSEKAKRLVKRLEKMSEEMHRASLKGRELSDRLEAMAREALKEARPQWPSSPRGFDPFSTGFEPPESVDETVARVLSDEEE